MAQCIGNRTKQDPVWPWPHNGKTDRDQHHRKSIEHHGHESGEAAENSFVSASFCVVEIMYHSLVRRDIAIFSLEMPSLHYPGTCQSYQICDS